MQLQKVASMIQFNAINNSINFHGAIDDLYQKNARFSKLIFPCVVLD